MILCKDNTKNCMTLYEIKVGNEKEIKCKIFFLENIRITIIKKNLK